MSSNGEGGRGGGHGGTTTKKMLQNIKEIVGGSLADDEIHAMLKECNMDPSETVHRLLNQGTFHEVKSKREKKKDIKDNVESRPRGPNNSSNRGGKGVTDRAVRVGSAQVSSSGNYSKPVPKKENGLNTISSSSVLGSGVGGTNCIKNSTPLSDSVPMENTGYLTASADSISSQYSTGVQNSWTTMPGQRTLADIVKMGKPPGKISGASVAPTKPNASHTANASTSQHLSAKSSSLVVLSAESHHVSEDPDIVHQPGVSVNEHRSHDEWPIVDQSHAGSDLSLLETCGASGVYADPSTSLNLHVDGVALHNNSRLDETHAIRGNADGDFPDEDSVRPMRASDGLTQVDNSGEECALDGGPIKGIDSYHSHMHNFEHHEANVVDVDVASTAVGLQRLCLDKEGVSPAQAEDKPAVIIPNHLQVTDADCLHLSFGSFGSGISTVFCGSFASKTMKSNLEMPSDTADATPAEDSDTRNSDYYTNEQLRPASNDNADCRPGSHVESYETPSQPDVRSDNADTTEGHQYGFQSSVSGYTFSNTIQPGAVSYASVQGDSQIQNPAPFSSVMQAYTSSLPSNLLASTVPAREFDLPFSSLLATQSMPTKYGTAMSSISGPTVSMPEAVKPGAFPAAQSTQQTLTATSMPTGLTVPQHLHVHPYSQPTLPMGHFGNMISYPFLPQSYTYMPSAGFPQAYTTNSAYHQPPPAVNAAALKYSLPQYKTSIAVSSLPQSAAVPPGLGGFGNSASIPGNFPLNPSSGSVSATIGHDEILSSQYKEGSHFIPQQNERSAMWLHGGGSRTMSSHPTSTYYSMQGQNPLSGLRQSQQPSHYGAVGYPNFYHSQASGVSQEHQSNAGDGRLNGSQGPTQTAHQIWQHNY
uniref:Phosphonoacetaldehyde hydrolase n=1 Tax=Anthurium amnicola TaxID=1678845 RepID=A0A1D1YH84_9ARAE